MQPGHDDVIEIKAQTEYLAKARTELAHRIRYGSGVAEIARALQEDLAKMEEERKLCCNRV